MNRFTTVLFAVLAMCFSDCTLQDDWPEADLGPKFFVEGYVDPALGARIYVSRTVPLGAQDLYPGTPVWVLDATVRLIDLSDNSEQVLPVDTFGIYVLSAKHVLPRRPYRISIAAAGLPNADVNLPETPPAPVVQTSPTTLVSRNPGCLNCASLLVKNVRVTTSEVYGLYLGSQDRVGFEDFPAGGPNGVGFVASGTEGACRVSFQSAAVGAGCDKVSPTITGTLSWDATTAPDTIVGHVAYVDPGYVDYIDALAINAIDFGLQGQFLYNIQSEIPSNVAGGYGFVRAQHTTEIPVERP